MGPIRAAQNCAAFNLRSRNQAAPTYNQLKRKYLIKLNMQANCDRVRTTTARKKQKAQSTHRAGAEKFDS